ncbi:hypothetical protein KYK30_20440 [Shinella yambaruensis]|uniref:Uncharacterized protein n=1 Tax=Shinella yambaruensis TaxID=415996 RepID=A0ABQ5ZGV1_9HYPH|nr:hypothetical protein [Shinella yambaruensis]MCJ8027037.1 hypothetical protein [Shinella yambaruensis]MCU7982072.1 hypothetical protein [Shinella yambaruensis]GLR51246.1 hypothetical protein GCM10007923_24540 [Shinella yambaruensis]
MNDPSKITSLIREALRDDDIARFPDFTEAVSDVCDELERFRSDRSYIIGHNDGWRDALRQEVSRAEADLAEALNLIWRLRSVIEVNIDPSIANRIAALHERHPQLVPGSATASSGKDSDSEHA